MKTQCESNCRIIVICDTTRYLASWLIITHSHNSSTEKKQNRLNPCRSYRFYEKIRVSSKIRVHPHLQKFMPRQSTIASVVDSRLTAVACLSQSATTYVCNVVGTGPIENCQSTWRTYPKDATNLTAESCPGKATRYW